MAIKAKAHSSTYFPSSRDMLHIVLGAQTRRYMAEVQFFGDYLNLHKYSTAGKSRGGVTTRG